MRKNVLGRTGFEVTEIGFGGWPIGGGQLNYGQVPEEEAHRCIKAYIEQGGNFIDTARGYGESERIIGDFFQRHGGRGNIFIASKTAQLKASSIRNELEESLRLLQSDYIDLYYLHAPPDDPEEMMCVLDTYEQLKEEGKIRAIGASVKGPNVTQKTVDLSRQYIQSGRVDVLMVVYSIFRQKNREIFQEAHSNRVGIVGRTVLESGFLTGRYLLGYEFTGDDHRKRWGKEHLGRILEYVGELKKMAITSPYATLTQIAIRFALDQPEISSIVVGAESAQEVLDNVEVSSMPSLPDFLRERLVRKYSGLTEEFNTGP